MNDERYSRQVLAFGEEGQKKIEAQRIGIVGLGGLGSQVVQALAYKGVRAYVLIDDDRAEVTNLNRLAGAFADDVGIFKVELAKRHIQQIQPAAEVLTIAENLRTTAALKALMECNTVFGCVDHDGPRLVLMELASAYEVPFIDSATEIFPATDDTPFDFGGRVVVSLPGDFCLDCAQQIDREMAKQDLESIEIRAQRRRHGYGLGDNRPAPAVFSLNGIVSNLAVTEFMVHATGLRPPARHLKYKGMRGVVTRSEDTSRPDCFTCGYLRGQRDKANIWRYLLPGETKPTL